MYSYKYQHDDGRVSYPLCFIFSSPVGKKVSLIIDLDQHLKTMNVVLICMIVNVCVFLLGRLQTRAADDVRGEQKQTGANCPTDQG